MKFKDLKIILGLAMTFSYAFKPVCSTKEITLMFVAAVMTGIIIVIRSVARYEH